MWAKQAAAVTVAEGGGVATAVCVCVCVTYVIAYKHYTCVRVYIF